MRILFLIRHLGFLLLMSLLALPASATVVGEMREPENKTIVNLVRKTKQYLVIRCASISDLSVLRSLIQANKRGIRVRILLDQLTPSLERVVSLRLPNFAVRVTSAADKGNFPAHSSYLFPDKGLGWYGVKEWSPKTWKNKSEIIIDSRHPDFLRGTNFEKLWQRGKIVPAKRHMGFALKTPGNTQGIPL